MRPGTFIRILRFAAVAAVLLLDLASAAPARAQTPCSSPSLAIASQGSHWESYADYQNRTLSVGVSIVNNGPGEARSVALGANTATGGARLLDALPAPLAGSIGPSTAALVTLRFYVPAGTHLFRSSFFVTAQDACGAEHRFPAGSWPGEPPEAGCPAFPDNNVWNAPVDGLPVDANSDTYVAMIGGAAGFHADFGSGLWAGGPIGIPYVEVQGTQPLVPISFDYSGESDPGPYPIPADVPIEGGSASTGDRHVLVIDRDNCRLYEVYHAFLLPGGSWQAGSGAVFDLRSNNLRPAGWTSADAAGLPIYPGLVRFDEVASGEIRHAIRFTVPETRMAFIWPARHFASDLTGTQYPPMGQRFRLKAGYDISGYAPEVQVILTAMKRYGIILADNGAPWYIGGVPDERWNNDDLHQLDDRLRGSDFEAVDESSLMLDPDSGAAAVH